MMPRGSSLVRLVLVLLLAGTMTTNCSWLQRARQSPRQHWWEFWKPKNPNPGGLFYPKDIEPPPAPPPAGGLTAPGAETLPLEGVKPPLDVAGTLPETRPTRAVPRGMTSQLQTVHFSFDRYDLTPEAKRILDENAKFLVDHPDIRVLIEGHCDSRGTVEYNLHLGQRRADTIREYLVSKGVPADRLQTISYGEERPVDPAENEEAWAKNRRAQFQVF